MGLCPFLFYCNKPFNVVHDSCYFIFHPGRGITILVFSVGIYFYYVDFLGGIIVLFLHISILSNSEKMQIPARVRNIGLIFFLGLFVFNTQNFFSNLTCGSGTRSE